LINELTEAIALRAFLENLASKYGKGFEDLIFDPDTYKVTNHNQLLVNGQYYRFQPGQMGTTLEDGDVVALIPPVVGG
jgi:molybdopterin converting factor small subunit